MIAAIDAAMEFARSLLQGDGYDVELESYVAGELKLAIVAGPEACAECLVPKDVLSGIIASTLPAELAGTRVSLTYPLSGEAD